MKRARIPVNINGIRFDALISSEETYSAKSPSYPTDEGFVVNDTVVLEPFKLSMTLFLTETPVTWKNQLGSGRAKVNRTLEAIRDLFKNKTVITVVTTDNYYNNMVLTSMTIPKSTDIGYAREIKVEFTQVYITSTETVDVSSSYSNSGTSNANSGRAKVTTTDDDPTAGINEIGYNKAQANKTPTSILSMMLGGLYDGKYTSVDDLVKSASALITFGGG